MVGIGNGLILGYLMYTSGLMPRRLAMFGLVGIYLTFKGLKATALGLDETRDSTVDPGLAIAAP